MDHSELTETIRTTTGRPIQTVVIKLGGTTFEIEGSSSAALPGITIAMSEGGEVIISSKTGALPASSLKGSTPTLTIDFDPIVAHLKVVIGVNPSPDPGRTYPPLGDFPLREEFPDPYRIFRS